MKFKKRDLMTLGILVFVIIAVGIFTYGINDKYQASKIPQSPAARNLTVATGTPYTDLEGQPVDLSKYSGKTLIVNSWASWCPFCVNELQDFSDLATEYKDRDVVVIAINRKEPAQTAKAYIKKISTQDQLNFVLDPDDRFYKSIGGFSMPETIFYDRNGEVSMHKRGFMKLEEMKQHTEAALQVE